MEHTRPERAAAYGAAFEIARLQNTLTTNLVNAAYQPADPGRTFTYQFLGPLPGQPLQTNPTLGQAAAGEMAERMRRELEAGRRRQALSSRDHHLDIFFIALLLGGLVLGARWLASRQGDAS